MSRSKLEPWPVAVGLSLLFMIGVCLSFWAVARANPDPLVSETARPGLEP